MMNSPPNFSVEQLLHARQNGVPDYVVVPLLQKTMALKQASAQQAALQGAPQKAPPIAQQVLGAAHQDQQAGIAALQAQHAIAQDPQALPEGHAGGGILAFAQGGGMPEGDGNVGEQVGDYLGGGIQSLAPEGSAPQTTSPAPAQDPDETDEVAIKKRIDMLHKFIGENPANAEMQKVYEERQKGAEDSKSKAPWIALMKAGAAMAQTKSPYFMSALGEGLGAGADEIEKQDESYNKQIHSAQDLKVQLAQAKRAEDMAIMNHGYASLEAKQAREHAAAVKAEVDREKMQNQREMQQERLSQQADLTRERIQASKDNAALAHSMSGGMRGAMSASAQQAHIDRDAARYNQLLDHRISAWENNPMNVNKTMDEETYNNILRMTDKMFYAKTNSGGSSKDPAPTKPKATPVFNAASKYE
jgi:hypothetical protein